MILIVALCACKKKAPEVDPYANVKGTYFSIMQFTQDQWDTYAGMPYTLTKIVTIDGKTDSNFAHVDTMNWGTIFKYFFETDISAHKYLGHYDYTDYDDDDLDAHNYLYTARDRDLFTRKLLIGTDKYTSRIKFIYIETAKSSMWNDETQKLYYAPLKSLQIQQLRKPFIGATKETKIEYRFP